MSSKRVPTGDLGDCGCGPGPREVESLSGLGEHRPAPRQLPRAGDFQPVRAPSAPAPLPPLPRKKPRKKRSKGTGAFCVLSHKGNTVHCYHDQSVAERVARRFGERSGTRFTVQTRKPRD